MEKISVSVIVPCYNHGKYIDEAVDSVLAQTFPDYEIIIINDGSTDQFTNEKLENYTKPNTQVIKTINQGLSMARNTGIEMAKGKYILPLDADDKIHPQYLSKAVEIIERDENIGIVYGKTEFFEANTGIWDLPPFSFPEILLKNSIVCTSLFRRKDWEVVRGYNKNMIYGYEDLDFWLSIIELNRKVVMIPEVLFYYRKKINDTPQKHSILEANSSLEKVLHTFSTLVHNHPKLYAANAEFLVKEFYKMEFEREKIRELVVGRDRYIIDLEKQYNSDIRELKREIETLRLKNLHKRIIDKAKRTLFAKKKEISSK